MYACGINQTVWESTYSDGKKDAKPFGFHDRTMRMKTNKEMGMTEYMLSYKYLIVIAGVSSADRLNTFLAHSGAVILLQETDFRYHYSAFLKPWVHYGTCGCDTARDALLSVYLYHVTRIYHSSLCTVCSLVSDDEMHPHHPHTVS